MKKNSTKILIFSIMALLSFSGCSQKAPCPVCPTITIPHVEKQSWEPLEVDYERIR